MNNWKEEEKAQEPDNLDDICQKCDCGLKGEWWREQLRMSKSELLFS